MWRAVLTWVRDLLAEFGLCESSVDRTVREAHEAFRSAIDPSGEEGSGD